MCFAYHGPTSAHAYKKLVALLVTDEGHVLVCIQLSFINTRAHTHFAKLSNAPVPPTRGPDVKKKNFSVLN
jgi:hypothetical protein